MPSGDECYLIFVIEHTPTGMPSSLFPSSFFETRRKKERMKEHEPSRGYILMMDLRARVFLSLPFHRER